MRGGREKKMIVEQCEIEENTCKMMAERKILSNFAAANADCFLCGAQTRKVRAQSHRAKIKSNLLIHNKLI